MELPSPSLFPCFQDLNQASCFGFQPELFLVGTGFPDRSSSVKDKNPLETEVQLELLGESSATIGVPFIHPMLGLEGITPPPPARWLRTACVVGCLRRSLACFAEHT